MAQSKTAQQQQHPSTTTPEANTSRDTTTLTDSESDAALAELEAALASVDDSSIADSDAKEDESKPAVPTHGTRRKITAIDDARAVLGGLDEWDPTLKDDMAHAVEEAMAAAAHGGHSEDEEVAADLEDDDEEADLPPMTSLLPEDFDEYLDKDSAAAAAAMHAGISTRTEQSTAASKDDASAAGKTDSAESKEAQDASDTNGSADAKKHSSSSTKRQSKAKAKQPSTPDDSGETTDYPYSMQQVDLFGNVDPFNGELLTESASHPVAPAKATGNQAAPQEPTSPNSNSNPTINPSVTATPSPAAPQAPQGNSGYINPQSLGPVKRLEADTKYWLTPPAPLPEKTKVSAIVPPYVQGYALFRLPMAHPEPDAASVAHALEVSLAIAYARDYHDAQAVAQLQQEQYTVSPEIAQELGLLDHADVTDATRSAPAEPSIPAAPVVSDAVHLERLPLPPDQQHIQAYDVTATRMYAQVKTKDELRLEQAVEGLIYLGFTTMDCFVQIRDLPIYATRESPKQYYPLWEQIQAQQVGSRLSAALPAVQIKRASTSTLTAATTSITSSTSSTPSSPASLLSLQGPLAHYGSLAAVASAIAVSSGLTPLVPCSYDWQVEFTPYPQLEQKRLTDARGITLLYNYTLVTEKFLLSQLREELQACRQIVTTIGLFRATQDSFNSFDAWFNPLWMRCRYSGEIIDLLNDFTYDVNYYVPIACEVENPLILRLHYDLPDVAEILVMLQEQQVNLFLLLAYCLSDNARRFVKSGRRPHKWRGGSDEFSILLNLDDETKAQAARVCAQGLEQREFWPGMSLPQLPPAYKEAADSLLFRFLSDPLYYDMWCGWVRINELRFTPRGKELLQPFANAPITDIYSPEWFVALNQLVGFPDGGLNEALQKQEQLQEEREAKIPYHHPLPGRSNNPRLRPTAEAEIQIDDERHRKAGLTRIPLLESAHTVLAQSVVKQVLPAPVRLKPQLPPPTGSSS